jgi:hypothetical protein
MFHVCVTGIMLFGSAIRFLFISLELFQVYTIALCRSVVKWKIEENEIKENGTDFLYISNLFQFDIMLLIRKLVS